MRCPQCGQENDKSAQSCSKCETLLPPPSGVIPGPAGAGAVPAVMDASSSDAAMRGQDKKKIGGWLAFFVFTCIVGNPAIIIYQTVNTANDSAAQTAMDMFPNLKTIDTVETFVFMGLVACSIYSGVMLLLVRPNAVDIARAFLVILIVVSVADFALVLFASGIPQDMMRQIIPEILTTVKRSVIYAVVWLVYLSKSSRVKKLFA